jgi:hypothetical protein
MLAHGLADVGDGVSHVGAMLVDTGGWKNRPGAAEFALPLREINQDIDVSRETFACSASMTVHFPPSQALPGLYCPSSSTSGGAIRQKP